MRSDYWDVTDEQVIEKTGHPIQHWRDLLAGIDAGSMKSNDVVAFLQTGHGVPRYWARTLTTGFLKSLTPG